MFCFCFFRFFVFEAIVLRIPYCLSQINYLLNTFSKHCRQVHIRYTRINRQPYVKRACSRGQLSLYNMNGLSVKIRSIGVIKGYDVIHG